MFQPEVGYVLNNLADFYREQGQYVEAMLLYQSALSIRELSRGFAASRNG